MNEYVKSIILALVQGLTEFLPVSSSGHLLLLGRLGLMESSTALFLNLMLHMGTLLAVITVYRKRLYQLIRNPKSDYLLKLVIATIPTVILAALFKFVLPDSLLEGKFVAVGFMITTVLLISSELLRKKELNGLLTYKNSLITGIVQGIAVLPGISRSGSTISTLRFFNVSREAAADFSFLLSIPIIIGSALVETVDVIRTDVVISWGPVAVGVAVSFVSGLIAIKLLLKFVKKYSFIPFGIYTGILAILCLIFL
ncbi:MAG: undecaprenyl-diphosphate phosphatase [Clostridia bacterium]